MFESIVVPLSLACTVCAADAQALYKLTLNLGRQAPEPVVVGVNNIGASVGYADYILIPGTTLAFAWPTLGDDFGIFLHGPAEYPVVFAHAINDRNIGVGEASTSDGSASVPCVWIVTYNCTPIRGVPGATASSILAINNRNQMTGWSAHRAARWTAKGKPTDLGLYPGDVTSHGNGIGSTGTVVGASANATGEYHAIMWHGTNLALLPALEGTFHSEAYSVNGSDIAVGYNSTDSGSYPIVWNSGTMAVLPGTGTFGIAWAINDEAVIVGQSNGAAVRWTGPMFQTMEDLNNLHDDAYPGAVLQDAVAISSNGIIVGPALYNGMRVTFTLVPQ